MGTRRDTGGRRIDTGQQELNIAKRVVQYLQAMPPRKGAYAICGDLFVSAPCSTRNAGNICRLLSYPFQDCQTSAMHEFETRSGVGHTEALWHLGSIVHAIVGRVAVSTRAAKRQLMVDVPRLGNLNSPGKPIEEQGRTFMQATKWCRRVAVAAAMAAVAAVTMASRQARRISEQADHDRRSVRSRHGQRHHRPPARARHDGHAGPKRDRRQPGRRYRQHRDRLRREIAPRRLHVADCLHEPS